MDEIPLEAPADDVVEQRTEVRPAPGDDSPGPPGRPSEIPWDADPADVAEQLAEVPLDDDWA